MAARWIGLTRPAPKKVPRPRPIAHAVHVTLRTVGVVSAGACAIAFNLLMFPDVLSSAYAQTGADREMLAFFAAEPAVDPAAAPLAPPVPVDEEEVRLLAATAWGEARSEGEDGMRAVAHVIVNRVGQRFGDDLETVIRAPKQFSAWNIGDPNRVLVQNPERYARGGINKETWETAQTVAREVLSGQSVDPTAGALFYHTRAIRPWWARYGAGRREIGAHVFYRDVPDQTRTTRVRSARVTRARAARGGRVGGTIRQAALPAPTTTSEPISAYTPSPEAAAAIAQLPTSNSF